MFALTALGVAGIVVNLIRLTVDDRRPTTDDRRPTNNRLTIAVRSGFVMLSVVFVLLAGNQGGALQVVTGVPNVLALSGGDMWRAVQNGFGSRQTLRLDQPFQEWGAAKATEYITPENMLDNFNWWNPSRALWDGSRQPDDPTKYYAITEFPMFSFWLGDMHPHVMALPFGLLALALALATLARPAAPVFTLTWRGWLELILSGIVLGSLYAINSWDFPTYMLMYLAALLVLYVRLGTSNSSLQPPAPSLRSGVLWPQFVQHALLVVVASFALFAPFYLTFKSLVGAKDPLVDLPLLGTLTRTLGVVTWSHTSLHTFVIIFGLFLLPLATFVFAHGQRVRQAAQVDETEPAALPARAPREVLGFAALPVAPPSLQAALPWVVLGALAARAAAWLPAAVPAAAGGLRGGAGSAQG